MTQSYAQMRGEKVANEWQADAISKCYEDPELVAQEQSGDLCISCMMDHPCICDWEATIPKMREFYEANRRIHMGESLLPVARAEPVLNMSWGRKGDALMDGLYRIAREPYKKEIARLHAKLAAKHK